MILNPDEADRLRGIEDRLAKIESRLHAYFKGTSPGQETESRFRQLVEQWEAETNHLSSIRAMAMHPCYQEIIGMGSSVLPLLLQLMRDRPGHWSWALRAISGVDPVPEESRGKLKETAAAWTTWGREQGYLS